MTQNGSGALGLPWLRAVCRCCRHRPRPEWAGL